jgi:hypothetical protein
MPLNHPPLASRPETININKNVDDGLLGCNAHRLIGRFECFGGTYCLPPTLKMKAVHSSKTLVSTYKSTLCYNPEDQQRCLSCHENLKSQI